MKYDDLLAVPFLSGGRTLDGLDCYGLVIECLRRDGKALKDLAAIPDGDLAEYVASVNVRPIQKPHTGCIVQFCGDAGLHVGYAITTRTVLHITYSGVRISPLVAFRNPKYFEVAE